MARARNAEIPLRGLIILAALSSLALTAKSQTLSPTSVSFGKWVVETTSTTDTITLNNSQTIPLTINSISVSGDFAQTSKCPITPKALAAGASCKILITFTPTALGTRTATLSVNDNSASSPQTTQLSGIGVPPAALSGSLLAFGNQFVNTTSAIKSLTLQNNQTIPLTITGISTTGDFSQTSTCPLSPNTLAAKLSCTISVTFTPTALGARSGTLSVNDNAQNSPQTAQLTGTGAAPVTLSPASLTFASQVFGSTSAKQSVTLKNNQTVPLTISSIAPSGDFAQTSTCPLSPSTLKAGASCTVSVTFTPTALGSRSGTLTIDDNANTSPQTLNLSGTGTLAGLRSISVTPANPQLPVGRQLQLIATGTWTGSTVNITQFVSWSSSAPTVAPVSSAGVVEAVALGTANASASYGSVTGATTITATPPALTSITVIPANPSVPVGAYQQFTAVLSFSDGSTKDATGSVSWSSSATSIATIGNSGLASALAAGSTSITATAESVSGSATLSVSQPQCTSIPPGIVGWWTGDGNTVDIAGSNSGALQNGAAYANAEVGQGFSFSGGGASVLVNAPVYSPTAGTLMFWFLGASSGSLTGSYDGTNRTPGFSIDASGNLNWEFGELSAQVVGQVNSNQWSHVALTYSTSNSQVNINVYLNGNLAASAVTPSLSSWYPQLAFGSYLGAQRQSFNGSIDEIAIFNQALSGQQIQQIYNAFSAGMCKPTLQSITVTPANASLAAGLSQQFAAVGSYSDGTVHDLTNSATWNSSNGAVATVNGIGQATTVATGSTTIAAALGAATGSTALSVVPSLISIQVNPQNPSIAAGTSEPFSATGYYSDGSTQDVTASVSWSSSLPSVATISTGGLANGIAAGQSTIQATAGSVSAPSTLLTVTPATLTSITVTPASSTVAAGTTQQFTAMGYFSDGSTQNLTTSVSWQSSITSVASISGGGIATGLASGSTTITASSGSVTGSAGFTVTAAVLVTIAVSPANSSALVGSTEQFAAIGTYSDNSTQDLTTTATWNSSNTNVATVGATGSAYDSAIGSTTVSASFLSVSGSTTLTVAVPPPVLQSISITPANPTAAIGQNQQLIATGFYSDGSTQNLTNAVGWNSSQTSVAQITNAGLATGVSGGSTTITAAIGTINAGVTLNVNSPALVSIAVTPANPSIALGTNQQFTAIGTYGDGSTLDLTTSTTWSSSTPSVATAGPNGLATSATTGQTLITASAAGVAGTSKLTVTAATLVSIAITPAIPTIPLGTTEQFAATGTFSDGSTQNITNSVQWNSSDSSTATVSNAAGSQGLANSVATGNANISASSNSITASTTLTVGVAALASITVNPPAPSIALGTTQQFTATGTFTDGSSQDLTTSATWVSGNTVSATVNSSALATSVATGAATISATLGSVSGATLLTVTPASVVSIAVNPATTSIPLGLDVAFTASGTFTDGSTQDVTSSSHWSSSVPSVATISNTSGSSGMATSVGSGSTVVSATSGSAVGTAGLTVSTAILASIEITPQSPFISTGSQEQFTATGLYTDGSTANITANSTWSSSSAVVATISNGTGAQGLASGASSGTARITAISGSITGSTTLTVQDQLVSINIAPANANIMPGTNQQFTATGTYASGITQDVTNSVLWSSSSSAVATMTSGGLAMSAGPGQTTVSATSGSTAAAADLTVADALGTASSTTVSCPTGGLTGATCYAVTLSCPNINDFTGYVKVNYPTGSPIGSVVFTTSGNGTDLYESSTTYGKTAVMDVLQDGFTVAQVSWGHPFAVQTYGWQTGPGGIRAVACRYATLAQWIYTNIQANTAVPFCATGNSAGGEQIGQALAHYGLGSIFAMVEPTSGPPFARQDWACDCLQLSTKNPCGVSQGYCVGLGNAENFIDPAYPTPMCSSEVAAHSTTFDATFLQDSIMAPDAVLSYPNTFVKLLYGGKDTSTAPNQAQIWGSAITSSKTSACVADAGHEITDSADGAQQIANDIVNYCKLPQ